MLSELKERGVEYVIRPATRDDYDELSLAFTEVELLHRTALPHVFRAPDDPELNREHFAAVLVDEDAAWLVAEHAGAIIGFVKLRIMHALDRPVFVPRSYAEVDSLAVRAQYRRAGIGRALMERAERWAAERGLNEVQLNVWEFNQGAIAFYEELGYVTERRQMRRVISNGNS